MMSHTPRLTIGMPVRNGAQYIRAALDSILSQSFSDFELIISDNASNDDTGAILRKVAAADNRVIVHSLSTNIGAAANFNFVLDAARAPYFKWATHDDACGNGLLQSCVRLLDRDTGIVLAYARTLLIDGDGAPIDSYDDGLHLVDARPSRRYARYHSRFRRMGLVNPMYGVARRDDLRAVGGLGAYGNSDIVLLGALAIRGKIYQVDDAVFYRRVHAGMTVQRFASDADRLRYLDPSAAPTNHVYRRMALEHARVVARARLSPVQLVASMAQVMKFVWWRVLEKLQVDGTAR